LEEFLPDAANEEEKIRKEIEHFLLRDLGSMSALSWHHSTITAQTEEQLTDASQKRTAFACLGKAESRKTKKG